jgi:hypothetical protein
MIAKILSILPRLKLHNLSQSLGRRDSFKQMLLLKILRKPGIIAESEARPE